MKVTLPGLLTLNAGYVDAAGFLALKGLFTAHVTGNFVTLGSALVLGTSGVRAKLLAIPMFCAVLLLTRLLSYRLHAHVRAGRTVLALQVVLLTASAGLAIWLGPFADGNGWPALVTGMAFVAAMAVQVGAQRLYLPNAPTTTMMTGNTTKLMMELGELLHGIAPEKVAAARARVKHETALVVTFVVGCAAATGLFAYVGVWCFLAPPFFALVALFVANTTSTSPAPATGSPLASSSAAET
jgi:uncharacterized membrane protein YoaK (UPF0700 family)